MRVEQFPDAPAMLERAGAFLAAREAEHNLLFGILDSLSRDPTVSDGPPYLAVVVENDDVVAACLRTPPRQLVLSEIDDLTALAPIVDHLVASNDDVPSVVGPVAAARAFAEQWTARTGAAHRLRLSERAFRLSTVTRPRATAGSMRLAAGGDFDLLVDWLLAFVKEALPDEVDSRSDAETVVHRWLDVGTKRNYLWEVAGEPVSWAGVGGRTPNGTRVGPVYTPPEHRGRGYASALVAAASQAQLDEGLQFCFLFTDLANPTANHIYQAIGYEPVTDIDVYAFG